MAHCDAHIEHFQPSSKFPAQRFSWGNLYASCGPANKKGRPRICGDHKDSWTPVNHIEPTDPTVEQKFAYDAAGGISPSVAGGAQAAVMIKKLNLDDPSLRYQRAIIIESLNTLIGTGEITADSRDEEIAMWRSVDRDGRLKSFGHVAARYLEEETIA